MTTAAKCLKPGDRVKLPPVTLEHVIVIGPEWQPKEVWLQGPGGHVFTLPGDAMVELLEPSGS